MNTPDWHASAKRLRAEGMLIGEIARRLRRPRSSVAWALDIGDTKLKHRERVRMQRRAPAERIVREPVRRQPAPPEAPSEPVIEISRKPTLPHISMPDLDAREPMSVLRFAPRTRFKTPSAGAERIRQIHQRMIREGRIPEPGLPGQLHH